MHSVVANSFPGQKDAGYGGQQAHDCVRGHGLNSGRVHQHLRHERGQHGAESGQHGTAGNSDGSQGGGVYFRGVHINGLEDAGYRAACNEEGYGSGEATRIGGGLD